MSFLIIMKPMLVELPELLDALGYEVKFLPPTESTYILKDF